MGSRSTRCRWSSPTSSSLPRHSIPRSRRAGQRATNDGYVNKCPALCRELLHISVTDRPTAARAAQQIVHAFPDETGPSYLLRNRDAIYGADFQRRVERMGIRQVVIAPRAPWQNPFAERVIAANASTSSSCSTNATCVACFARTSCTTTSRGLTRVSVTTAHAGARYSRSRPGLSSQSRGRWASSPLPARCLTARGLRLPATPRSSVPTGMSCVDAVIWPSSRGRRACRVRRDLSRSLYDRLTSADRLFDQDTPAMRERSSQRSRPAGPRSGTAPTPPAMSGLRRRQDWQDSLYQRRSGAGIRGADLTIGYMIEETQRRKPSVQT